MKLAHKFLIISFGSLTSCMDSKLPKYVELNDLRVLALVVDKPESNPGDTVQVTPIISDINESTSLTYEAYGCIDPGVSSGADASCENNPTKVSIGQGTISAATNSEMAQNFTGSAPSFNIAIPSSSIIFSQRSEVDQLNGVSYLIQYKITNSRGTSVQSIKRLIVSKKSAIDLNLNPVVEQFLSNGTAITSAQFPLVEKFSLSLGFSSSSKQIYTVFKDDGLSEQNAEELTTTWFITDGSLKFFRTTDQDANEYTAPESLVSTRKSFILSVTRDNRGGVAIQRICGGVSCYIYD